MGVTPASVAGDSFESALSTGTARAVKAARRGRKSLAVTRTMTEPKRDRSDKAQKYGHRIALALIPRNQQKRQKEPQGGLVETRGQGARRLVRCLG